MYEEFFGHFRLQRNPFHASLSPQSFYSTAANAEALSQLVYGIKTQQGILVLTGEAGTGKTTVLQYLLEWLRQNNYSSAYVFHTVVSSVDLLRLILRDFGIPCASRSKSDLLIALKEWLKARNRVDDYPVIIVDEAQGLASRLLDELRMLVEPEVQGEEMVQLVLAGQPRLEEKLRRGKLEQLRQRIVCYCKLRALTEEETGGYIASRLAAAGRVDSGLFPSDTVREVFRYSKGIPRVVNLLCEHALLVAYADRRETVGYGDVIRVARQFEFEQESTEAIPSDTFCRLIPYPRLAAAEAPATEQRAAEVVARVAELDVPLEAGPREEVVVAAAVAAVSEPEPEMIRVLPMEPSERQEEIVAAAPEEGGPTVEAVVLAAEPSPLASAAASASLSAMPVRPKPLVGPQVHHATSRFALYWREVGESFVQDGHDFLAWLRRPRGRIGRSAAVRQKAIAVVSGWLRQPLGSGELAGKNRRVPAATQKHF